MLQELNEKNTSEVVKQLERIADNLYRIAEQIGSLNVHAHDLDHTLQEIRNILDHLKAKKMWMFWKTY